MKLKDHAVLQVVDRYRSDAIVLKRNGHTGEAEIVERFADDVMQAVEPLVRFISEADARMRSGWTQRTLRKKFAVWEAEGFAYRKGNQHFYLLMLIPQRVQALPADDRAAAVTAARRMMGVAR